MGLLGSAAGRALAGGAGAMSRLAEKYIDEGLAQDRAKFLADLQFQNTQRTEDWQQSDAVQSRRRDNATKDVLAAGAAKDATELASLNNQPLNQVRSAAKDAEARAETGRKIEGRKREFTELTPAEVEAENAKIKGTTGAVVEREGLLSEARARAQAKFREPRENSMSALNEKLAAIDKMDFLDPEEKKAAKKALVGLGKQRDPELDTETVTDERMNEDGTVTKTQRKQVRRPGQGPAAAPSEDPLKAAMDKARAAKTPPPGSPAPAASPAAAPAAAPTAAPSAPSDPLAGKSRSEIREIEGQLRADLARWQGKPGAEKRAQEIQALLDRIANGQY